ncbi:MAG: glycosyltransferase family 4 protein, partial [Acidimicrobiia bacterium]|nr:glycosyltransferase family 4 protein [Acidimicrobiia bacterium]
MRVLVHASRELAHPHAGGSEVYMDQVLQGLHDLGDEVHLATAAPVGERVYETSANGGTFSQFFRAPIELLTRRRHYDVVIDVANGMTFYSPLFRRRPTICLVHHIHTRMWAEWFPAPVAAFGRFLERRMMPLVYRRSIFIAVSPSTSRELQRLGVAADRIRIVHNSTAVPTEPLAATDPVPLFVACGRLVPHKQFHLLLEHWPTVRAATGGRLVIIGEGPERSRLEDLLTEGASLAGRVDEDERDRLLARATALLHPSYVEGWGLVIMEAAAQGTPAVGFDVPGVRDSIVDGETGWICHDVDHLVKQWIATTADRERLDMVSAAA